MPASPDPAMTIQSGLDRALAVVDEAVAGASFPTEARRQARSQAGTLFEACGPRPESVAVAQLAYVGELVSIIAVDLAADLREAQRLADAVERVAGVPKVALGRELLQTGRLLELPVDVAIEVRLALLLVFSGATTVTLWTSPAESELKLLSRAGAEPSNELATRQAASALLAGAVGDQDSDRYGQRIDRLRPPMAAVLTEGLTGVGAQRRAALLTRASAPILSALLDRETLLGREPAGQESVLSSLQRRLARLRYDLHDGPQQDVHLLAQDLSLFREQLRPMVAGDPNAGRVLGRLDDLEAQLVALDGDLRRLSSTVQSPLLVPGSLPEALRTITDAFAARTGVEPEARFSGDLDHLTDSQQIAMLSLIREALSNIRKHSNASHVTITVGATSAGLWAEVTDDGRGFDPESTLVRAAQAGRLGLVGMHERVRMLGGRTQIDSRPGGPTVISATLPPWPGEREL